MYSLAACWEQSPKAVKCAYAHAQMPKHVSDTDNVIISYYGLLVGYTCL